MRELRTRKRIRLKEYDYGREGAYFITICSYEREYLFSEIASTEGVRLSNIGMVIDREIQQLLTRYPAISIDKHVIMPNHVHLILFVNETPTPLKVGDVIGALKSLTTKRANEIECVPGRKIWQFRFHDHIIRNEEEYRKIWDYIDTNPQKWREDYYFIEKPTLNAL